MSPIRTRIRGTLRRIALPIVVVFALLGAGIMSNAMPRAYAATTATPVDNDTMDGVTVNICSNSNVEPDGTKDGTLGSCGGQTHVGGVSGAWWQCVEFVQRFYTDEGWHSGIFSGVPDGAYEIYTNASQNGFSTQANRSISSIAPGDMIVHGMSDKYSIGAGHVAIVDSISSDGTKVYVHQQNAPTSTTYSFDKGTGTATGR